MASRTRARINNLNSRAREVGAAGVLTLEDIDALKAFYDFTCLKCGNRPAISPDHVKPLALGGSNTVDNLQLLCENCNKGKGDEEIDYRSGKVLTPDLVPLYSKTQDQNPEQQEKAINWHKIKSRYLTEEIALRDLAQQEGISSASILKRSAREHWAEQREQHRIKVTSDVITTLAAKDVDARIVAADTARAVIDSWLASVKEEASANDALNAAKLLLLLSGEPTERTAHLDETDLDASDIISAAGRIAARADRKAAESDYSRGDTWQDGSGAGWTD